MGIVEGEPRGWKGWWHRGVAGLTTGVARVLICCQAL